MEGYIGLYRCLLDKSIWKLSTPEQKTILITLLLKVNHAEAEWEWQGEKFKVKPGQMITSLNSIAEACGKGISVQNVRTALKRFEKLGFLTNKSTNKSRLITIVNWRLYQVELLKGNKDINKHVTNNQQRDDKDLTTNNNNNNNIPYEKIINYLNNLTGKNFKHYSKSSRDNIADRWNEGYKLEDFKRVIDIKVKQWKDTENDKFLRPITLFGSKFESYFNERVVSEESDRKNEYTKAVRR